jgi:hypothetical protein
VLFEYGVYSGPSISEVEQEESDTSDAFIRRRVSGVLHSFWRQPMCRWSFKEALKNALDVFVPLNRISDGTIINPLQDR